MPDRFVFIVSTGRAGTKALTGFLNRRFPEVHCEHQPPGSRPIHILSNRAAQGRYPMQKLQKRVLADKLDAIKASPGQVYVETNSMSWLAARTLAEELDNTTIIQVVRDPRTFVPSMLDWKRTRWKSWVGHNFIPYWQPTGRVDPDVGGRRWRRWDEYERMAWVWAFKNQVMLDTYADQPGFRAFRFEDLVQGSSPALPDFLAALGLPFEERLRADFERPENASRQHVAAWSDWPPRRCQTVQAVCGPLMERFNYGDEVEWQARLEAA